MSRQILLPGTTPRRIAIVHDAAEAFLEAKAEAKAAKKKADEAGDDLIRIMRKSKLDTYHHSGMLVQVTDKTKVKVERVSKKEGPVDLHFPGKDAGAETH